MAPLVSHFGRLWGAFGILWEHSAVLRGAQNLASRACGELFLPLLHKKAGCEVRLLFKVVVLFGPCLVGVAVWGAMVGLLAPTYAPK